MATQYNIKPGTKVGSLIKKKTTDTKSKSSSRSSSKKTIVIYDSTGKVTQSNDPNRPVGMVDTSKAKESVTKDIKADDTPTSTVFQRKGGRITKQTFQKGGMVSSEVVQTKDTPKAERKTTSQLAREQQIISQIQKRKAFEQKETQAAERRKQDLKTAQQKWETGQKLTSADLFRLQAGEAKVIQFGTTEQKQQLTKALAEREAFFKPKQPTTTKEIKTFVPKVIKTEGAVFAGQKQKEEQEQAMMGVIRSLTKQEKIQSLPVIKQFGELKSGFKRTLQDKEFISRLKDDPSLTGFERVGGVLGGAFIIGTIGGAGIQAPLASTVLASEFLPFLSKIGKPVALGLTAQQTTTSIAKVALPEELKQYETNVRVQQAYSKALERVRTDPAKKGTILGKVESGVLQTVPIVTATFKKSEFKKAFEEELEASGFNEVRTSQEAKDAYTYARAKLARAEGGEFAALVGAGAATELIGSKSLSGLATKFKTAPKLFLKSDIKLAKAEALKALRAAPTTSSKDIFKSISAAAATQSKGIVKQTLRKGAFKKEVFKEIATLGFAEGLTESLASDIARDRPVDIGKAVLTGAIAAPFAGALGASIASSKGIKRTTKLGLAYALDPSEPIGDVTASLGSKIYKAPKEFAGRVEKAIIMSPAFAPTSILLSDIAVAPTTPSTKPSTTPTQDFKTRVPTTPSIVPTMTTKTLTPTIGRATITTKPLSITQAPTTPALEPSVLPVAPTVPVVTTVPVTTSVPVSSSIVTSVPVAPTVPVTTTVTTTTPTTTTVPVTTIVPTIPTIPLIGPGAKAKKVQGYNVLVKQGGKYVQVNDKPLSYGDAVSRGGYVTDNTSAATFKLSKSKKGAEANKQPASFFTRDKFRSRIIKGKQVKQPNTFIEKNAFRIDSRGELQGITARGLLARENKRRQASAMKDLNLKDITGGSKLKLQAQRKFERAIGKAKLNKANSGTFRLKGSTFRL